MMLTACSKDDEDRNTPNPLPSLSDPDDVCSCMDDLVFKKYCYDNFDLNGDGKVSRTEAAAVTKIDVGSSDNGIDEIPALAIKTLTGIGYFSNLESINCGNCQELKSVDLSYNLKITSIEEGAFAGCTGLTSITFPNSLTSIDSSAFILCSSLSAFYGQCASKDHRCVIFEGELVTIAPKGLTEYKIPDGVITIGIGAFENGENLTSITIPNGVVSIGDEAFYSCRNLTNITISESVTSIGEYAFKLSNLSSIYFKGINPPEIDGSIFDGISSSAKIYVPMASVDAYKSANNWRDYASQIVGYNF